jgi:hypothetical protein
MNIFSKIWRSFEDFFVCTPSQEQMTYNQMGEEFYEKARIKFRKSLLVWMVLSIIPLTLEAWTALLSISSGAVLYIGSFNLEQKKSTKGYPYLEPQDGLAMIIWPLVCLIVFHLVVWSVIFLIKIFG